MNQFPTTRMLCVAVLFAGGAGAAHAQALPAPSSGWVAAASVGGFHASQAPFALGFGVGWETPVAPRLAVRGGVVYLNAKARNYDMSCVQLPGGGCLPPPEYPAIVWSAEAAAVISPFSDQVAALIMGAGAALPRGNLAREANEPGGIRALGRAGIELGRFGQSGIRIQLGHTWYFGGILDVSGVTTLSVLLRSR